VADRAEQAGNPILPFLPNLLETKGKAKEVTSWTEAAMNQLKINPPDWTKEQSPLEKVLNLTETLVSAAR
jgi:hypothetical protein